jgi:hypothetical protein
MIIFCKHSGYQTGIRLYPGGKGGSTTNVPAPDPRLIEAQIKSMGYQDTAIQQMMANSASLLPVQREQLQFGLDAAKLAQTQSQDDRGWMLDRRGMLSTSQDQMAKDAADFNAPARQEQMAAMAGADVNKAFGNIEAQQNRAMARSGKNLSGGASAALANQTAIAKATASAGATNASRAASRAEGYALTDRSSNALAGYPAMGMTATGNAANFGTAGTGLANATLTGMNSGYGATSSAAGGMGSNAGGMYGTQSNAYTSANNAANAADGAAMQGLGSMAGMAMMAF